MIRHTDASLRSASLLRFREASRRLRRVSRAKREALLWYTIVAATLAAAVTASALLR